MNGRSPYFERWLKFSVIGAAGLAIQLAALWVLTTVAAVPAFFATMIAVETALLHNFIWHEMWTWRGESSRWFGTAGRWGRLLRFHLATGVISLASNTILTLLIRDWLGIPLLAANVIAVGITAILNFTVADLWIFRSRPIPHP